MRFLVPSWKDRKRPLPLPSKEEDYGTPVAPI